MTNPAFSRLGAANEIFHYLRQRRLWWLMPIVLPLALFRRRSAATAGGTVDEADHSDASSRREKPFIYKLF